MSVILGSFAQRVSLAIIAVMLLATSASSASTVPAKSKEELIEIERRIGGANLNCDYRYFEQIEAQEFTFTGSDGSITTRAQDLAGEATCKKSTSSYDVDETNVWLNGQTAVVTGRITIRKAGAASQPPNRSRFTDVFVFRDRRWQLVFGHSSHLREPSAPAAS